VFEWQCIPGGLAESNSMLDGNEQKMDRNASTELKPGKSPNPESPVTEKTEQKSP